ncbi:MAG: alanine--tRNA ligase [Tenericutes bacterium HGW-Tenericutes-1]|nr:MAG: alanine--tRNA ligase [Tenericutes bacterium HGW-Tenericutes-1]
MKYMKGNEIRQMWLDFFQEKGHGVEKGASLIPNDDPTLLWMNAGVAALKKYFDGSIVPKNPRIVNAQKCIRTNDIENVGKTARHHTFFEMLGNFSIGDYFRIEAVTWGYELITSPKWLGFDKNRLYMTVYPDDFETRDLWIKLGMDPSHIIPTEENNFWEIGEGPCGPCTEIFYDRGPDFGDFTPDAIRDDIENDRYVEFWNIVFSQYNAKPGLSRSEYPELPNKNIDTGCGLERLTSIIQGVKTNFETDLFMPIIKQIEAISGVKYEGQMAFKVIADHIRTVTFAVADGAILANEGRGYVLRRLLRRAVKYGKKLGIMRPFMDELVDIVIRNMDVYYPYLNDQADIVKKIVQTEETKFLETIASGEKRFEAIVHNTSSNIISGIDAFILYDTYGFPIELTQEYAEELKMSVDIEGFKAEMEKQKDRARNARKDIQSMKSQNEEFLQFNEESTFVGYDTLLSETKIIKIFKEGLVLEKTPFYATSGGQVADTGVIYNDKFSAKVTDVFKLPNGQFLHVFELIEGSPEEGMKVNAKVDVLKRNLTAYNHSATHLLFKSLRDLLGSHISQQGSQVTSEMLRFDFNHFESITDDQILELEKRVNDMISNDYPTHTELLSVDEAVKKGAIAEFGEKYGDTVRVIDLKYTLDLCGGTHVKNIKDIHRFAIKNIFSIGSGIYRIEGLTNIGVESIVEGLVGINQEIENLVRKADVIVSTAKSEGIDVTFNHEVNKTVLGSYQDVINKRNEFSLLQKAVKELEKEVSKLKEGQVLSSMDSYYSFIEKNMFVQRVDGMEMNQLKQLVDNIANKTQNGLVFVASVNNDKVMFLSKSMSNKYHCGELVKAAAQICGGNGGGRPDYAQAGGKDTSKVDEAIEFIRGKVL